MHPEAITSKQKIIFRKLKDFSGYYLAGGTALALQIGHRVSVDFDFFSQGEIPTSLLLKVEKIFKDSKREIIVNNSEQLTVKIYGINLTFVKYPFPLIFKLKEYQGVKMLGVEEIAATKAYVLGRRATMKDYVDLYFILKDKRISLKELIKICQKKYGNNFEPRLFLEQLIFMGDVRKMTIRFLGKQVRKEEMLAFFEQNIRKIRF